MFQAKAAGRNTLRFFDAQMQAEVSAHAALEADLREALVQQQQFLLHYQPQVVGAGRITGCGGAGALAAPAARHGVTGRIYPAGRRKRLILQIGQWVLETACAQLAAWAKAARAGAPDGGRERQCRQFKQSNFVDSVLATLAAHPAPTRSGSSWS
jgi:EAL domain-containing protein (putative c-di-GMP-specific phosphodiesterase class I)